MADTTKQPLSVEEMIHHLGMLAFNARARANGERSAADGWASANPKVYPEAYKRAEHYNNMAEENLKDAQAADQAVAILTVLNHPDFTTLSNFHRTPDLLGWPVMVGFKPGAINAKPSCALGATVLEAILKAHDAIQASKEVPSNGQTPDMET